MKNHSYYLLLLLLLCWLSVTIARVLCSSKYFAYAIIFFFFFFLSVCQSLCAIFCSLVSYMSFRFIYYWLVCTLDMIFGFLERAQDLFVPTSLHICSVISHYYLSIRVFLSCFFSMSFKLLNNNEYKNMCLMVANRVMNFIVLFQYRWQFCGLYEY